MALRTFKKFSYHLVTSLVFAISCLVLQETALSQGGYPVPYSGQMGAHPAAMMSGGGGLPGGEVQPIFYGSDAGGGNIHPVHTYNRQQYNPEMVFGNQYASPQPTEKKGYTTIPGAFFRLEYIAWDMKDPGTTPLGEGRLDGAPLSSQMSLSNTVLPGLVPSTTGLSLDKSPGFRITSGIPLIDIGTVEMSAFAIGQSSDSHRVLATLFSQPAITFLVNGSPSNIALGYDSGISYSFSSRMWGTSLLLVMQDGPPGEGLKFQPVGGIRYFALREKMKINAAYTAGVSTVQGMIESDTINHAVGITAGLRTEFVHRWVTLGVEPKVTLAGGSYRTRVASEALVNETDPFTSSSLSGFSFTPAAELGAYVRVHPTKNITLSVGYDYMVIANMARPQNSIQYDIVNGNGVASPKEQFLRFEARGFSASIEWIYR